MRSTALAICCRMALIGISKPAIMIMVSSRAMASRGVLAWQRGHRAVVAGVHGLEHVERFGTAALADDDAFGPHTQGSCGPDRWP